MASKRVASVKSATASKNCMEALASALLEWFLLLILFVYAASSYMITKFASYCGLNTPCLLCSRLDHVFGNRKVGYYWDMICRHHKTEISSLVLCHAHDKLADVHQMCESCLFSFATINKSNAETYRLLVGKLGEDSYSDIYEDTDSVYHELVRSGKRICACCNEPCTSKGYAKKLMLTRSFRSDFIDIDCSVEGHVSSNRDTREITAIEQFHEDSHQKIQQLDQLTRVGYIKLKINSDTESEVLFSEDDAEESLLKTEKPQEKELRIHRVPTDPLIGIADPHSVISSSSSKAQLDGVSAHDDSVSDSFVGQGLEKTKSIDQETKESNVGLSPVPELISFADMDSTTDDAATPHDDGAEEDSRETSKDDNFIPPDAQAASNSESIPVTTKSVEGSQQFSDNISLVPNLWDLGDAYKLAVANRGKQFSGLLVEQWLSKDSSKVSQDLRNLFSQLSISRGLEHSLSDLSPKMSINSDELRTAEASSSGALQSFQKRIALERNESGLSIDGSVVSEIEGETAMDRLKRQIDHDRKALSALYKELEEERNSSAESTNQAMAMINRLQEEKATLQMEALQYLRMMEEQAEYDMEALQKTNDLLSEREKEIQDLETELEYYRNKYPNDTPSGITMEVIQTENGHEIAEIGRGDESMTKADASDAPAETKTGILKNAAVEIEEEKLHILSCLEKLEKKLELSSKCREDLDLVNVDDPKVEASGKNETEEQKCKGDLSGDCVADDYDKAEQINTNSGQCNPCSTEHEEAIDDRSPNQRCNDNGHIPSLKKEYWQLLERMEALESDHRFLEHTINCLQVGEEGLQFVQDIASRLRELRTADAKDN
ncbi:hypothetical protein MLD38_017884 [Melastoma candidum]|uniref:Uncharacterized protein n=1 Tax=Melastoma candidum TaxID=119954 RepID=A0ACB9QRJ0_9MYRT|nr:hypothetical protein MLD38_017884 [Melastoma candidum]